MTAVYDRKLGELAQGLETKLTDCHRLASIAHGVFESLMMTAERGPAVVKLLMSPGDCADLEWLTVEMELRCGAVAEAYEDAHNAACEAERIAGLMP